MTDDYVIAFLENFDRLFVVTLQSQPLGRARKLAEVKLLEVLQMPKEEVCKLNITVNFTEKVQPEKLALDYGLSFCPGSKKL